MKRREPLSNTQLLMSIAIGIFIFMLLAGPGKISLDYIIGAHFTENVDDEQVIDNA